MKPQVVEVKVTRYKCGKCSRDHNGEQAAASCCMCTTCEKAEAMNSTRASELGRRAWDQPICEACHRKTRQRETAKAVKDATQALEQRREAAQRAEHTLEDAYRDFDRAREKPAHGVTWLAFVKACGYEEDLVPLERREVLRLAWETGRMPNPALDGPSAPVAKLLPSRVAS